MVYVVAGSGTAQVGEEQYPLERESMLWLSPATEIAFTAGPDGSGMHAGPVGGGIAETRPGTGEARGTAPPADRQPPARGHHSA